MTEPRKLDIVLFGATGFTGGLVAEYLCNVARSTSGTAPALRGGASTPLRWAIAGRNREKLEGVLASLKLPAGSQAAPQLVLADAADAQALGQMVGSTRAVITTVGPYGKYGEPLVRACAELGTDYVDLTGEPEFVVAMRERYHAIAERNRTKIVHACGFDSIPHDLGAYFTLQALRARMSDQEREQAAVTIEGFVRARASISGGTWQSALEIMANSISHGRKQARAQQAQGARKATLIKPRISYRRELGFWAVPMPTIDPEVVLSSAALLPEYGPDFRYGHYTGMKYGVQVAGAVVGVGTVFALAQLPPARALLKKLRSPGQGPSAETRANSYFRVRFEGRAASHHVSCEVRGGDPGYGETSKMIAESALCLVLDRDRLPAHYGVVPSAAALGNPLIERLQSAGVSFREL